jgi:hypothetical protein
MSAAFSFSTRDPPNSLNSSVLFRIKPSEGEAQISACLTALKLILFLPANDSSGELVKLGGKYGWEKFHLEYGSNTHHWNLKTKQNKVALTFPI